MCRIAPGAWGAMGAVAQGFSLVADDIMYVTQTNECYALDAGTGRQVWV